MMGKVIMSGIVPQLTVPYVPIGDPVFANNDWATIIKACQSGKVPETWEVGDQKAMTINGTDYAIDIIGKNHDTYADGTGKAPLTFQLHKCYDIPYAMNVSDLNSCGWVDSTMRTTTLLTIMALMPSEVQTGLREVNKLTSAGYRSNTIVTSADKLFLLSEIEVFGTCTYSYSGEGSHYAYYAAGNSKCKEMKNSPETYYSWRLRSPRANYGDSFCAVDGNGSQYTATSSTTLGVAFAFCF